MSNKQRKRRDYLVQNGLVVGLAPADEETGSGWDQATIAGWDAEFNSQIHRAPLAEAFQASEWMKGKSYVKPCDHVQDEIAIGPHRVLVTGGHDVTAENLDTMMFEKRALITPHLGIYLDQGWARKMTAPKPPLPKLDWPTLEVRGKVPAGFAPVLQLLEVNQAAYQQEKDKLDALPDTWRWPHILVGWPDRGTIAVDAAVQIVSYILLQLRAGKVIDMGCAGAHGRTGTLLAMLLIEAEELDPESAIVAVRERHCRKAIESDAQVRAIFGFGGKFASAEEVKRLGK